MCIFHVFHAVDTKKPLAGQFQKQQPVIPMPATCPTIAVMEVAENMRAKIYCLICKLGTLTNCFSNSPFVHSSGDKMVEVKGFLFLSCSVQKESKINVESYCYIVSNWRPLHTGKSFLCANGSYHPAGQRLLCTSSCPQPLQWPDAPPGNPGANLAGRVEPRSNLLA